MKIQALVLAGGEGKRLFPLSLDKNTLPFLGKPLVEYVIDDLLAAGVKEIVVVANRQNEPIFKKLARQKKAKIKVVVQAKPQGMADAVLTAAALIKKPLLVVNGSDLISPQALKSFLAQCRREAVALGALKTEEYRFGGYFKVKNGRVLGVVEKPAPEKRPSNYFRIVLDYFSQPAAFLALLKTTKSRKDDVYERALTRLIKSQPVKLLPQETYLGQIKYPWMILQLMRLIFEKRFKRRVSKKTSISQKALVRGPVIIEDGVRLFEGAVVVGPAYLGKGVVVGNNAMIRHSMIGPGSVVGFGSEIVRSWVGPDCWFHSNYVGDSVIEGNVSFGAKAVVANLRLDEAEVWHYHPTGKLPTGLTKFGAIIAKDVRLGVGAMVMPGRWIGEGSLVGPGVIVSQNVEPFSFLTVEQRIKTRKQRKPLALKKREEFKKAILESRR